MAPARHQPHPGAAPADRRRASSSRRGTSLRRWRRARSARRWRPDAPVVLKPASETPLTALAHGGAARGSRRPRRRCQRRAVATLGPGRERHAARPARPQALVHGLDRSRSRSAPPGGRLRRQLLDGARRQRAIRRVRRCRPRAAVAGAMVAKMRNGGEACTAANRFYVQRGIADAFSEGSPRRWARSRWPGLDDGVAVRPADQRSRPREGGVARRRRRARRRTADRRRQRPRRTRLLLPANRACGRAGGCGDPPRGDLRACRSGGRLQHRGGGGRSSPTTPSIGLVAYVYTGDLQRGLRCQRTPRDPAWSA